MPAIRGGGSRLHRHDDLAPPGRQGEILQARGMPGYAELSDADPQKSHWLRPAGLTEPEGLRAAIPLGLYMGSPATRDSSGRAIQKLNRRSGKIHLGARIKLLQARSARNVLAGSTYVHPGLPVLRSLLVMSGLSKSASTGGNGNDTGWERQVSQTVAEVLMGMARSATASL